jgi:hypothetical protein
MGAVQEQFIQRCYTMLGYNKSLTKSSYSTSELPTRISDYVRQCDYIGVAASLYLQMHLNDSGFEFTPELVACDEVSSNAVNPLALITDETHGEVLVSGKPLKYTDVIAYISHDLRQALISDNILMQQPYLLTLARIKACHELALHRLVNTANMLVDIEDTSSAIIVLLAIAQLKEEMK